LGCWQPAVGLGRGGNVSPICMLDAPSIKQQQVLLRETPEAEMALAPPPKPLPRPPPRPPPPRPPPKPPPPPKPQPPLPNGGRKWSKSNTVPSVHEAVCPYCVASDQRRFKKRSINASDVENNQAPSRTRKRRDGKDHMRVLRVPKFGKFWQSIGYSGDFYCRRCSEVFRDHMVRQNSNSAQCTRSSPCDDCAQMLVFFPLDVWEQAEKLAKTRERNSWLRARHGSSKLGPKSTRPINSVPSAHEAVCPYCVTSDQRRFKKRSIDASGVENNQAPSKTRKRRDGKDHMRVLRVPKFGKFWQSIGYSGDFYCRRCSEVFRDHMVRQNSNSAQCTRSSPCDECAQMLVFFPLDVWEQAENLISVGNAKGPDLLLPAGPRLETGKKTRKGPRKRLRKSK
jgi:hypothetical protein